MSVELKEKIQKAIENRSDDDKFLAKVYAAIEEYEHEEIVCYDTKGNALTQDQYEKKIIEAADNVKQGNYLTSEEVRNRIQSWGNA